MCTPELMAYDKEFGNTLRSVLWPAIKRGGNKVAIIDTDSTITYNELASEVEKFAELLIDSGVKPGQPVALAMPNSKNYVVADLALILVGAARVLINDMLSEAERVRIIKDSDAAFLILGRSYSASRTVIQEKLPNIRIIEETESGFRALFSGDSENDFSWRSLDGGTLAQIIFTGGTTGRPKAVLHTQKQLASNILAQALENEVRADDTVLIMTPLPHASGYFLQVALMREACIIIEKGFAPEKLVYHLKNSGATYSFLVPTMMYRLLQYFKEEGITELTGYRTIFYGGGPSDITVLSTLLEIMGPVFAQLYGQSEAPNFLTKLSKEDHRIGSKKLQSCGRATAFTQIKIVDEIDQEVDHGVVGEVAVKTPFNTIGYLGNQKETSRILKKGWLHTGDFGYLDQDGLLYLLDRAQDRIITGGLLVFSGEVERVLSTIPGVLEVAIIGVPHADWGQSVTAFVRKASADPLNVQSIKRQLSKEISSYKIPKNIVFVDQFFKTPYGKIDKNSLRELWLQKQ